MKMRDEIRKPLVSWGEIAFFVLVFVVVFAACFGLASSCARAEQSPEAYLRTASRYMHVPEPIDIHFWNVDGAHWGEFMPMTATIHYVPRWDLATGKPVPIVGKWIISINQNWWEEASYSRRLKAISHELCHAAYDHDVLMEDLWFDLPLEEIQPREEKAKSCALRVLKRIERGS